MVKTRRRKLEERPIKNEEISDESKSSQLLHNVNETTTNDKNNNKIKKKSCKAACSRVTVPQPKFSSNALAIDDKTMSGHSSEDTKNNIPTRRRTNYKHIAYDQVKALIDYVENDKMSLARAAKKTSMSPASARRYYKKYLSDPERKIPVLNLKRTKQKPSPEEPRPEKKDYEQGKCCKPEQIKALIGYIADDKLTVSKAIKKVGLHRKTGNKYYLQYLNDPNHEIPVPIKQQHKRVTNSQLQKFSEYIIRDKLTVQDAGAKSNMSLDTAYRYYKLYFNDIHQLPPDQQLQDNSACSLKEKKEKLIHYIINDKMSIPKAAAKVQMNKNTAKTYYRKYMKDPQRALYKSVRTDYTQEQIQQFIEYITKDKMKPGTAAKKAQIKRTSAYGYYKKYLDDSEHKIPLPANFGYTSTSKNFVDKLNIVKEVYNKYGGETQTMLKIEPIDAKQENSKHF